MPSRPVRAALCAALALALLPVAAAAHPGDHHPGLTGATPFVSIPFPVAGPSAGGYSSPDVEFVKNFPQHTDSAGGRKLGDFFYITTERDLTIYDVSEPVDPVEVGHLVLPEPGTPVFTEEDPDTDGEILLVSNGGVLMVIDVRDKTAPALLTTLDDADDHTVSCVLDCTWAYGSEGTIVDLRDPENPVLSEDSWQTDDIESEHDVTEVSPGIVLTSTQPLKLLDARANPEQPKVLASTPKEEDRFIHANLWPRGGEDDFLLVGGEAVGPGCSGSLSASLSTWDARAWRSTGAVRQLRRVPPGAGDAGRGPRAGLELLRPLVRRAPVLDRRAHVYVADYIRGLDVLRFTGDIGSPPEPVTTEDEEPPAPPAESASQQSPEPAVPPAPPAGPGCTVPDAFRSVDARRTAGGLALSFDSASAAPVNLDVFRLTRGRRVTGEKRVARFRGRTGDVTWQGRVPNGYYLARYRTRTASGVDTRRIALRRRGGRWMTLPAFHRPGSCDLLRSFKLRRPVFGGRTDRGLGIAYKVARDARVRVRVTRGGKLVRRFRAQRAVAGRTYRLRLGARGLPRGDYRVRVVAFRAGERVAASAFSRRL